MEVDRLPERVFLAGVKFCHASQPQERYRAYDSLASRAGQVNVCKTVRCPRAAIKRLRD
jgi:hypothetical protein